VGLDDGGDELHALAPSDLGRVSSVTDAGERAAAASVAQFVS
jgi:hypothetical protein